MNKKILIIGASSQIGDFLLPTLLKQGFQICPVSRNKKTSFGLTWLQTNIEQPETLAHDLPQAQTLIHIAPLALLPPILDVLHKKGIQRIIAFGTTSMFAKKHSHTRAEQHMVAKLEQSEQDIESYCQQHAIHWTIFRPTLIYGCGKDKNISFIARMMNKYHCFPIVGQASGLRRPVHSQDLAQACVQALHCPQSYNKAYNLSGAETLTYKEMLQVIIKVQDLRVILLPIPLFLFRMLVKIANIMPAYRYLTPDMANRMNQDLCFDHHDASKDFGYQPRSFQPPKV